MYGTGQNSAKGFQPSTDGIGSTWDGAVTAYNLASGYNTASLYTGDPVTILSSGTIGIATAGAPMIGVFTGVKFIDSNGVYQAQSYWTAGTVTKGAVNATAFIIDNPKVEFDIQVSTSTAGPTAAVSLVQSDMLKNANFSVAPTTFNTVNGFTPLPNPGTGNSTSGSAYYLNYTTIGTGADLNLKLLRFTQVPGNIAGVNFNNATVQINNHIRNSGTGTTGI